MSNPAGTTAPWRCVCGYSNLGGRACALCGITNGVSPRGDDRPWAEVLRPTLDAGATTPTVLPALFLGVVVIAGNIGFQVLMHDLVEDRAASAGAYLLLLGAGAFYFAVLWLSRSLARGIIRTRARATRRDAVIDGLARGGIAIAVAAALAVSLPARAGIDRVAAGVVDDGRVGLLALTFLVVGFVGPVVEEHVFRGVVTEGLLRAEIRSAVVISSALFAAAHLSVAGFLYYFAMGMVFGRLYLRRGLVASTVAHMALNTGILVIAFVVLHGGAAAVTAGSVRFDLPAGFHAVAIPAGDTFAATGPGHVTIELAQADLPPGAFFDPDSAAGMLSSAPAVNDLDVVPSTSHVRLTPFGNGVEATITDRDGHFEGVVVLASEGGHLLMFAAYTDGDPDDARLALERVLSTAESR